MAKFSWNLEWDLATFESQCVISPNYNGRSDDVSDCVRTRGGVIVLNLCAALAMVFVCLYPKNFKMAEPIGPKFCGKLYMSLVKVYRLSNVKKCPKQNSIFIKCWKSTIFLIKSAMFSCFCFTMYTKRKMFTIEIENGREAPWKPII